MRTYKHLVIFQVCLLALLAFVGAPSPTDPIEPHNQSPHNIHIGESVTVSGEQIINEIQVISRTSVYEIRDDDSVTPNHEYFGLPYYSSFTFTGPSDADWLLLEGNFNSYVVNGNQVTFYGVQDWLHFVYRTNLFVNRTTNQISFGVTSTLSSPTDVDASITYPANYEIMTVSPAGYTIPAAGRINWFFSGTTQYTLTASFSGLGEDRPQLDLPIDYLGRGAYNSVGFAQAFAIRTTSMFDHQYPNYARDGYFLPYTGVRLANPDGNCTLGYSCYDGHDGYDFDDRCPSTAPCSDPSAVYPAADGTIINAGWLDNLGGCQIVIDHGNNWTTLYAHLQDANNNRSCDGILRWSGEVTTFEQIGIIGESGNAFGTHLHFVVKHNNVVVDPSGWEPNENVFPSPWSNHVNGATSYPMWIYSLRTTEALNPSSGGQLASPTHRVFATVPAGFYGEQLTFNLSNVPSPGLFSHLLSTGHSFSLTALDNGGNFIHQLNETITLEVRFDTADLLDVRPDSIRLYFWDDITRQWSALPTTIDWQDRKAIAQVDHLSVFALLGETKNTIFLPVVTNN